MMKELKRLPFDERNEQDFEDLTRRIHDSLATIRTTRSIPATQEELAQLADCSRKTLNNRVWPIGELKKIKEARKGNKENKLKNTTVEHRLSSEKHIEREKLLIRQIRNLQEQNGKLFDQVQELEEEKLTLIDTVKVLEDEIIILKDEKQKVDRELRQIKQGQNDRPNVLSIQAMMNIKKGKKGEG